MSQSITRRQTPEERELEKKKADLAGLEARLAERELELATLQAELRAFERRYLSIVGVKLAELDAIEAQIAEERLRRHPEDATARGSAEKARAQAQESAGATAEAKTGPKQFTPSEDLKKLYRDAAKRVHPDTVTDPAERERRNKIMAEINRAYQDCDEERLRQVLREWQDSPEAITGDGIAAELVRVIRKIAQVEARLSAIEAQIAELKAGDLHKLKERVEAAEAQGRDLLAEMAAKVEGQIRAAHRRGLDAEISDLVALLAELKRRRNEP